MEHFFHLTNYSPLGIFRKIKPRNPFIMDSAEIKKTYTIRKSSTEQKTTIPISKKSNKGSVKISSLLSKTKKDLQAMTQNSPIRETKNLGSIKNSLTTPGRGLGSSLSSSLFSPFEDEKPIFLLPNASRRLEDQNNNTSTHGEREEDLYNFPEMKG